MRTTTDLVQQLAPLAAVVFLFLFPLVALRAFTFLRPRFATFQSSVMTFGAFLPWNWGSHDKAVSSSPYNLADRANGKKARVRTRADQVAGRKSPAGEKGPEVASVVLPQDALFPGLVNMSGTHCFMNSTLQALASLTFLAPYLLAIRTRAEALDVPTPVVDALIDLLDALNTPEPSGRPLRATALVEALCSPPPNMDGSSDDLAPTSASALSAFWGSGSSNLNLGASAKATALLASHEHQDAQELFQLISECVREDNARVSKEAARDRGFAIASLETLSQASLTSPFDGLTATRRSCVRCGYTAAIRHFAFDTIQLALESTGGGWGPTSVHDLLRAYINLEVLQDCACRRCELRATARRLHEEVERLESTTLTDAGGMQVDAVPNGHTNGHVHESDDEDGSSGKKKKKKHKPAAEAGGPTPSRLRRLKVVRRMEARVLKALETGRIEEEDLEGDWDWEAKNDSFVHGPGGDALKGVRIERVSGGVSTRQSMIGRPPTVLALHINRSVHTGLRVAKNSASVAFPEILDITPYTTDGVLSLEPTASLSGAADPGIRGALSASRPNPSPCLYRLAGVVCHFGQHSFGHYICYRRTPSPSPSGKYVPASPTPESSAGTGTGWLRISDSHVDQCGVEHVLAEGSSVFMLYYERIRPPQPSSPPKIVVPRIYTGDTEAADSAETIRPVASSSPTGPRLIRSVMLGRANGSVSSLSLLSAGSPEPDVPGTPKAATTPSVLDETEVVERLDLDDEEPLDLDRHEATETLPTPPPTPRGGSEVPHQNPKAKKKKKKEEPTCATGGFYHVTHRSLISL
ncbi:USP domain-containing protein [Mycena indigotica]|uniref:ubiquitinyl hydrolase 1 n=1 Tax=Mycena indigotica TaxID=2126181 RepID=A0A8H6W253_9AGAR|nr:USP domain-containing protein [Mycena indigotica]KAF7302207.1 USP domain-containing protein [Mycena indigotica]